MSKKRCEFTNRTMTCTYMDENRLCSEGYCSWQKEEVENPSPPPAPPPAREFKESICNKVLSWVGIILVLCAMALAVSAVFYTLFENLRN